MPGPGRFTNELHHTTEKKKKSNINVFKLLHNIDTEGTLPTSFYDILTGWIYNKNKNSNPISLLDMDRKTSQ